jgi:co-chaperonin GroES (HSP10)
MIGKIKVTSSGYNPDGPPVTDPTLPGGAEKVVKEVGFRPVGRRLMVAPEDRESYGNLSVAKDALAKELRLCVVLAVGPKVHLTHPQLTRGVAVWVKPFFGVEIMVNGHSVLFIKPDDVKGLVK